MFKKLLLAYLILIVLSLIIMAIVSVDLFNRVYEREIEHQLQNTIQLVKTLIAQSSPDDYNAAQLEAEITRWGGAMQTRITLIDEKGAVRADSERDPSSMENHSDRPEIVSARASGRGKNIRFSNTLGKDMLYLAMPLVADKTAGTIVRVSLPMEHITEIHHSIYSSLGKIFLILLIVATLIGAWLARRIYRPLNNIVTTANSIAAGDFSHKLPVTSKDEIGVLTTAVNSMSDELQRRFSEINEKSTILNTILSNINDGIIAVDKESKVVYINNAVGKLFDFDIASASGKYIWEIIRNDRLIQFSKGAISQPIESLPRSENISLISRQLRVYCASVKGLPDIYLIVIYDITEQNRFEQLRKDFVANVSHELRTPLTIISGYADALKEGAINDKSRADEFLSIIDKNARQLTNLVEDLLDLSRLESQAGIARIKPGNLKKTIERVIENLQPAIDQKQHTLTTDIPKNLPDISYDPDLLEKAITNLLDNAIKYTPAKGRIEIRVKSDSAKAQIEVADNGIGIPPEDMPRIFERFYRVDKSRSREMGGTGLGLAIAKHIVQLHSGEITVQSKAGAGTTFTIILPAKQT